MRIRMKSVVIVIATLLLFFPSCARVDAQSGRSAETKSEPLVGAPNAKVTFIELGSVNCIPCKAMQPVMESIRTKYPDQVSVLFYDVWTKNGEPYGRRFGIRVIPTQIFLDKNGKEYYRHEGFFPEEELVKILAKGGVKP